MFTAIFFFHFVSLSVHFSSCIWGCFFSSFEDAVHKIDPLNLCQSCFLCTGFKYISLLPRGFIFSDIKAVFCCFPLLKKQKPVEPLEDRNILLICTTETFQKEY